MDCGKVQKVFELARNGGLEALGLRPLPVLNE